MASSRATVRSRGFTRGEGGWSGFGPNPYEEERATRGARTLSHLEQERRQDERQALEQQRFDEREARLQAHEAKLEEIRHAEFLRKEAEQSAMADRKLAFEKEAAEVMPQLLRLDPTKPEAQEFIAKTMEQHPNLFISGFAKESVLPQIQSIKKEVEAARKAMGIDAEEKAALSKAIAAGGQPVHTTIGKTLVKSLEEVAAEKARADAAAAAKSAPSAAAKQRYQESITNAASLKARIDENQKDIDEQKSKGDGIDDESKKNLQKLIVSHDKLKEDYTKAVGRKEGLEFAHPELAAPASSSEVQNDRSKFNVAAPATSETPMDEVPPLSSVTPTGEDMVQPLSEVPDNPNLVPSTTPALASNGEGDGLSPTEMAAGNLDATMGSQPPAAVAPPATVTPGVVAPVIPPTGHPATDHQAAIDWANANPDDPRSAKIKKLHGIQ